jgi:signal transduction histidine kinase
MNSEPPEKTEQKQINDSLSAHFQAADLDWDDRRRFTLRNLFLWFYLLIGLCPVFFFTVVFINLIGGQFDERFNHLIDTGALFFQDAIQDEYQSLNLIAHQIYDVSIQTRYHQALKTRNFKDLKDTLSHYQQENNLDVLLLLGPDQKPILTLSEATPLVPEHLNLLASRAMSSGQVQFGVKRFWDARNTVSSLGSLEGSSSGTQNDRMNLHLSFMAAYPLKPPSKPSSRFSMQTAPQGSNGQTGPVNGVLLLGRFAEHNDAVHQLAQVVPDAKIRFLIKLPSRPGFLSSQDIHGEIPEGGLQFKPAEKGLEQFLQERESQVPALSVYKGWEESQAGTAWGSVIMPFKNHQGASLGYGMLSLPRQDFKIQALLLISLFLVLAVGGIVWFGSWFQSNYVKPMDNLLRVIQNVTQGYKRARVNKFSNIMEINQTLDGFNQMMDTLEGNERFRNTFVTTLTHDLKTPLIAQKRVLSIFQDEFQSSGNEDLARLAQGTLKNNDSLLTMVQMLLDVGRYADGRMTLCYDRLDLQNLVEMTLEELSPLLAEKNLKVTCHIAPEAQFLSGDATQLKRVLVNLLGNACEHVPDGETITISAQVDEAKPEWMTLTFSNTGPGLSPEVELKLFDQYVSSKKTQQKIGGGLGLYVCKMIVESHGGTIRLGTREPNETESNYGVCFVLKLPKVPKQVI